MTQSDGTLRPTIQDHGDAPRRRSRVLVVGPFGDTGGLARMARMTAEGFDRARFDIQTCDTAKDTPEDRTFWQACCSHIRRQRRLVQAVRMHRPALVHIHTCSFGTFYRSLLDVAACWCWRTPYILHVHGGLFAEFLASLRALRRTFTIAALRGAARIVVLSETWRTNLTREAAGLRISVIPNVVEPGPRRGNGPRGGIVFVGDLSETKRPEDLIVAYAALPSPLRQQYPLTLIGGGSASRRRLLEALAQRLAVSATVRFTGSMPHDDVRRRLIDAALFVLPSRAEGMPLALLEAMRAGVPCVATHVGAVPDMATDGEDALLVPPLRPETLARAMRKLLEDPSIARRIAHRAAERVTREHAPDTFRNAIAALWLEVGNDVGPRATAQVPRLASSTFRSVL